MYELAHGITREELAEALTRNEGNMQRTAHELGVHRDTIFSWAKEQHLWPLINELRRRAKARRRRSTP